MGDAYRITTDDGAGLDHDIKKLRAMKTSVNEKLADKNKKIAIAKVSTASETRRTKQAMVNTWVENKEDQNGMPKK